MHYRFVPSFRFSSLMPVGLLALAALSGCFKPAPGGTGDCRRLTDPPPGMADGPLPGGLYAELRESASGTVMPILLEGSGGSYTGTTAAFEKCQSPGPYTLYRTALYDLSKNLVAVAKRDLNNNYQVVYGNGGNGLSTTVGGTNFSSNSVSFNPSSGGTAPTLVSVSAPATTRQGDTLTLTSTAMAAADDCGIDQVQWWLTTSPHSPASPAASVVIKADATSGPMKIPATLSASTYTLEGRILSKQGRTINVGRQSSSDTTYKYLTDGGTVISTTTLPVVTVTVAQNPDADQKAPQAQSFQATPGMVGPCQSVQLVLQISDDKPLTQAQQVMVHLGPLDRGPLTTALLSGSGNTLTGSFVVPLDAPAGVWLGYPDSIKDDAGNIGRGSLSGGQFSITGPGITSAQPVMAATFLVQGATGTAPDGGRSPDLRSTADLGTQASFPALLRQIMVSPSSLMTGTATATVSWTDNSNPKILP